MTQRTEHTKRTGRRVGYVVAIAVNVAFLVIVNNVLEWGWFSWLTEELEDVLPIINVSLVASIIVNAVYVGYDASWFKALAELGLAVISLIVTIRLLQVFPFDFSTYEFGWGTLTRWLLGVAIFGICVAMIVQLTQLARAARATSEPAESR